MRKTPIVACLLLVSSAAAQDGGAATPEQAPPKKYASAKKETAEKAKAGQPGKTQIAEADRDLILGLLAEAGGEDARLKVVERTPERQTRVMYELAKKDLEHAQNMYCDAGDKVLERFDPDSSREDNLARMQKELLAQLPYARELGCLNHIENPDVYAVDVRADDVAKPETLIAAAKRAVKEGKLARFRYPPRHPGSFHFELKRTADKPAKAKTKQPTQPKQGSEAPPSPEKPPSPAKPPAPKPSADDEGNSKK